MDNSVNMSNTIAEYKKLSPEDCFDEISNFTDTRLSIFMYSLLKGRFKCDDIYNNIWYYKSDIDNTWKLDKYNHRLRIAIIDIVHSYLIAKIHKFLKIMQVKQEKIDTSKEYTNAIKLLVWLETDENKEKLIKASRDIFYLDQIDCHLNE